MYPCAVLYVKSAMWTALTELTDKSYISSSARNMPWWVSVQEASSWNGASLREFLLSLTLQSHLKWMTAWQYFAIAQKNQYAFEICSNMRYGEAKTSWFIACEDWRLQWKYHCSWPEGLAMLSKQDRDETAKRHGWDALLVGVSTQEKQNKKIFSQDHVHLL